MSGCGCSGCSTRMQISLLCVLRSDTICERCDVSFSPASHVIATRDARLRPYSKADEISALFRFDKKFKSKLVV